MCGINGIFAFNDSFRCDEELATRMRDTMSHRGPDDGDTWGSASGTGSPRGCAKSTLRRSLSIDSRP
jgi:asparagine synthetase B (glutamine-hydrolysing)